MRRGEAHRDGYSKQVDRPSQQMRKLGRVAGEMHVQGQQTPAQPASVPCTDSSPAQHASVLTCTVQEEPPGAPGPSLVYLSRGRRGKGRVSSCRLDRRKFHQLACKRRGEPLSPGSSPSSRQAVCICKAKPIALQRSLRQAHLVDSLPKPERSGRAAAGGQRIAAG